MSTHRAHRRARRVIAQFGSAALGVAGIVLVATTAALPVADAAGQSVSTTTNVTASTGNGSCLNPNSPGVDPVNCNAYDSREDVWLSNLPQGLPDGDYFFAVNDPGTQSTPNDGETGLLSSDSHLDRSFRIQAGTVVVLGLDPARIENGRVQMYPFDETSNGGGVYIASVCSLDDYPAAGSDCTHDAFKVGPGDPEPALPPTVSKTAEGGYTTTYAWTIDKSVDDSTLSATSGTVTANYTVSVGHDAGTVSGVHVDGTITVANPNPASLVADVTDVLSDGTVCTVTGGDDAVLLPGDNPFAYTCSLAALPAPGLDNAATVSWDAQAVGTAPLDPGSASGGVDDITFTSSDVDECADVTDTFAGALGQVCVGDDNPTTFTYPRSWTLTDPGCVSYPNTATFTTTDTGASDEDSESVQVCKTSVATGAHTIGFWTNQNGQAVIKGGASTGGVCNAGTYLRTLNPFKDLSATATCAQLAKYVTDVIGKAKASDMTTMLKAQMLGTALSVYFLNPSLGTQAIDLAHVDGKDVRPSFGGASSMTVNQALTFVSGKLVGSSWYGGSKTLQEGAKNLFDAINNSRGIYAP